MKIVVIDIGGTSIKSGIWENKNLSSLKEINSNSHEGGLSMIKNVIALIKTYDYINAIGVSSAGQINFENGSVHYANPNIPNFTGLKIKDILEKEFNVPAIVENDVNSAAIGEWQFGVGKNHSDFLCLTYGTGIGGAIFLNNNIFRGNNFSAGEFGNTLTHAEKRNPKENIMSGCYETYASTNALVNAMMLYDKNLDSGRKIFENINNPEIKKIIDTWIFEVIYGLTNLIYIFNPSLIILGGGIMEQDYIINKIKKEIYNHVMESYHSVAIKRALNGNNAGMLGAAYLAENLLKGSL